MSILNNNHPSFGCVKACFVFRSESGKLFVLELRNQPSIEVMERIHGMHSHHLSAELMFVVRDHENVGVRSRNNIEEIDIVSFLVRFVNPIVFNDELCFSSLRSALTDRQIKALATLLERQEKAKETQEEAITAPTPYAAPVQTGSVSDAKAALSDLGFKKDQVNRMMDALGHNIYGMTTEDIIKKALANA